MAFKEKKSGISLANLLTIAGLALFGVFSYFGYLYLYGGEIGTALLWALLASICMGVPVAIATVLKQSDKNVNIKRIFQIILLVGWAAAAFFMSDGLNKYLNITEEKEEIKKAIENDVNVLEKMFADYKAFENNTIENTALMMNLSCMNTSRRNAELETFLQDKGIDTYDQESAADGIDKHMNQMKAYKLFGSGYNTLKDSIDSFTQQCLGATKNWNIMKIPVLAKQMEEKKSIVAHQLKEFSKSAMLPKIDKRGNEYVIIEKNQVYDAEDIVLSSVKSIQKPAEFSGYSILIIAIIYLLILLNYIFAPFGKGKSLASRGKSFDDGGILLK